MFTLTLYTCITLVAPSSLQFRRKKLWVLFFSFILFLLTFDSCSYFLRCLFLLYIIIVFPFDNLPTSPQEDKDTHATHFFLSVSAGKEEYVATFKGSEFFCYDLSLNPIQSSSDEITLSFKTLQRNGLMLHTGKSADYVNLALKNGAVSLVINLGSGAFEALVEPVNGKFNDNDWHDVKVTRNLRQVTVQRVVRRLG